MNQKLDTLLLSSYDESNIEHRRLKRNLLNDENFIKYFGQMFIEKEDEYFCSSNELESKKIYIISDVENNLCIGVVRFCSYNSEVINIQCAIDPDYRRMGYASRVVKEICEYLFKNGVSIIEADIDKTNIGSIKAAIKAGFIKEDEKYRRRR